MMVLHLPYFVKINSYRNTVPNTVKIDKRFKEALIYSSMTRNHRLVVNEQNMLGGTGTRRANCRVAPLVKVNFLGTDPRLISWVLTQG